MRQLPFATDRVSIVAAVLILCSGYLVLKNLDSAALWDDEAETAIFARNLANEGELTAWDGRNLYGYRDGYTLDEHLRTRQPPLMFYAAAASFRLFGVSTWAARLPFALCGLGGLMLLYRTVRKRFPDDPLLALYSVAVMGFSMQFVLSVRECRYYSLCLTLPVLIFDQYRRCLDSSGRWRNALALGSTAIGLFLAHYLLCVVFLLALFGVHFLHGSKWSWQGHKRLAVAAATFMGGSLPYAFYHRIWDRQDLPELTAPWYISKPWLALWYLRDLNEINGLPAAALLAIVVVAVCVPRLRRGCAIYAGLALLNAVVMGCLTPQPWHPTEPADVRYLIGSLPFASVAIALVLACIHQKNRWLAGALCGVLVSSNILSLQHSLGGYKWLLPAYLREIHQPFPTEQRAAADALREYAKQDDLVMTIPPFESPPLLFYVGDKVQPCCLMDSDSPLVRSGWVSKNLPSIRKETNFPQWVVVYGNYPETPYMLALVQRRFRDPQTGAIKQYHYEEVKKLGVYYKATQRSELVFHTFGPQTDYPPTDDVYLLKRVD